MGIFSYETILWHSCNISVVLTRSALSSLSIMNAVNKSHSRHHSAYSYKALICDHGMVGQISTWLTLLSLRSVCIVPGPIIAPERYQAHMKAIKINSNQTLIGSKLPSLCVYSHEQRRPKPLHTHKDNIDTSALVLALFQSVFACKTHCKEMEAE